MNKPVENTLISIRMPDEHIALIDQIAVAYNCDRSTAIRLIVRFGAPMMLAGTNVNVSRILMTLEILAEDCLIRTGSKGQADLRKLLETAQKNYEQYHA